MNSIKFVCVGDSLTEGYGINKNKRWTDLLSKELNIEFINSGISGDTTAGMLARFNEMVIQHHPSHVIIMGGTNDISLDVSKNVIISNILAMTRHAKHHNIIPILGIPTSFYPMGNTKRENFFLETKTMVNDLIEFQKLLKKFVLNDEQYFIDFNKNMNQSHFLNDGLHPNEKGHLCMMKTAKKELKKTVLSF